MLSGIRFGSVAAMLAACLPTLAAAQDAYDPYDVRPPEAGTYQPSDPVERDQSLPPGIQDPAIQSAAPPSLAPLDVDRVMDRVKVCWTGVPKVYGTPAQGGVAKIRVKLTPDGFIDGQPMIIDKPLGDVGTKFATGAARAIAKCAPYRLPPERYNEWRQIEMRFDTIDPDNPPPQPPPAPAPQAPDGAVGGDTLPEPQPGGVIQ